VGAEKDVEAREATRKRRESMMRMWMGCLLELGGIEGYRESEDDTRSSTWEYGNTDDQAVYVIRTEEQMK
jgi:hypothetical protein